MQYNIPNQINDGCIQIGLILRNSIFISKMLLNSEVWNSITKYQLDDMEKVDRFLLKHTLGAHSKASIEWLHADTGTLNLKSSIQIRRLMYLWHILSRDKSELIYRIYQAQKLSSSVGDWFRIVQADMKELNINMTDEEIQGVPKHAFKTFVKKKVREKFIEHLNSLRNQHSKSKYLDISDLKVADYITDSN